MNSAIEASIEEDLMDEEIFEDFVNLDGDPTPCSIFPEADVDTSHFARTTSSDPPHFTRTAASDTAHCDDRTMTLKIEGDTPMGSGTRAYSSLESASVDASIPGENQSAAQQEKKRRRRPSSPEPDYQEQVATHNKKRKRTGQACDRCRCRRYKCDSRAEGCIPCTTANVPCNVTDSVTGETFVRGAAGRMAAEIEQLKAAVARLEQEKAELQDMIQYAGPPLPFHLSQVNDNSAASPSFAPSVQSQVRAQQEQIDMLSQEIARLRNSNQALQTRMEKQPQQAQYPNFAPLYH
ncbi:Fungal Zn(2)-Cys(6) binuclear cluster domain-containing protein [Penicillium ucsense]|uniref:Fungal Zn(2)-Cys(6) binuclear cluster domain-containing protein n=1 Tax=Penicillium ucsense TaxID=2839758 RepID=A0A8J8W3A1_9EURO|nr:Fungal Zn(2)-Cys(6) binuclear cluster domain-containing protein [Penicillium ucsense]KAF7735891.1 Fungal Zn(2)-Cys(6) binuclear cluster domain-containing protein [Penicillium ucsense]